MTKQRIKFTLIAAIAAFLLAHSASASTASSVEFTVVAELANVSQALAELEASHGLIDYGPVFPFSSSSSAKSVYRLRFSAPDKESVISAVEGSSLVRWAALDETVSISMDVNDEFYTTKVTEADLQWYLPKVETSQAWDVNTGSPNVVVAVVDTGVYSQHQDLNNGRISTGYKSFCEKLVDGVCSSRIKGTLAPNTDSDDNGHGTAVAAIIGATANNQVGVAGIAWNAKIMPIKVMNKDGIGTSSDVAEGIVWAAENGAHVINLSLGGADVANSKVITQSIEIAASLNVVVVAAAGNDQNSGVDMDITPSNPVCSDGVANNVLGVAATDSGDKKAVFSNYGSKCIDVSAPGVRMLTAHYDHSKAGQNNMYAYRSGSSFAAPLVSGAAALVKSVNPGWTSTQIKNQIKQTTDSIDALNKTACNGLDCSGKLGTGRLNIAKALGGNIDVPKPVGAITEGSLVRLIGGSQMYLIQSNLKRPIIPFVADQMGLGSLATEVSQSSFDAIPLGNPMPPLEETLVKSPASPLVYIIADGIKRPLTYFSFTTNGLAFDRVVTLDESYLSTIGLGKEYAPKEGTLLRGRVNPTVYVVEGRELHAMNLQAFNARNFSFSEVRAIEDDEVRLYPIGATYLD